MREAGRISGRAFNEVIRRGQDREKDIEATLEWLFRLGGCERAAYVPVVAGGKVPPTGRDEGLIEECFDDPLYAEYRRYCF